jgi:hypothetical protein
LLLAGCVGLPESGPVRMEPANELVEDEAPVDFTPDGPRRGAAPVEIVRGFLVAMQATPLNTSVARRFLTAESSTSWVPERGTVIYTDESRTALGNDVRLDLTGTVELDGRGGWLGERGDANLRIEMVRERGQWRISGPPDRLIIPSTHFESRYNQYNLYFFDKSGEVLVPEPVHVPGGAQAPTVLVSGLLTGPGRTLLGVERTYFPAGTVLDDISVPVSLDGTAEVPLSDEVLDLDDDRLAQALGQLAWTLGQVPGIERMRVTVDGSPLDLPGEGSELSVTAWSELSPAVAWANQSLFGVRDGRVVSVVDGEERRVSGVLGSLDLGVEEIAVDLPGERVAAVTDGGSTVRVAPRARTSGDVPAARDARPVVTGARDLLKPAWDLTGRLWLVDRTTAGAVVSVERAGHLREVEVAGITGQDVRSFVVSRDGTRLVAEVSGRNRDRLMVARVQRDQAGGVRRVLPADAVPLDDLRVDSILDVAFRTPGTLALLTAPSAETSQVVLVKVDGSTSPADATTDADVFRGEADRLVTSPYQGSGLYVHTVDGLMYALASNGRWVAAGVEPGLRSPTFVG